MRASASILGRMLMEGWAALGENLTPSAAAGQASARDLQLQQSCFRNHVGPWALMILSIVSRPGQSWFLIYCFSQATQNSSQDSALLSYQCVHPCSGVAAWVRAGCSIQAGPSSFVVLHSRLNHCISASCPWIRQPFSWEGSRVQGQGRAERLFRKKGLGMIWGDTQVVLSQYKAPLASASLIWLLISASKLILIQSCRLEWVPLMYTWWFWLQEW